KDGVKLPPKRMGGTSDRDDELCHVHPFDHLALPRVVGEVGARRAKLRQRLAGRAQSDERPDRAPNRGEVPLEPAAATTHWLLESGRHAVERPVHRTLAAI